MRSSSPRSRSRGHALAAFLALWLAATAALAHPDVRVVDRIVRLEPGGATTFPMAIHYHRLVGHVRVAEAPGTGVDAHAPADDAERPAQLAAGMAPLAPSPAQGASAEVTLLVVDEPTHQASGEAVQPEEATLAVVGARDERLNYLLRCCDQRVYSDYFLVVRNDGAEAVDVDLRVWNVHDDFAVVVDRAEPGAFTIPFGIFLVLGVAVVRATRRSCGRSPDPGVRGRMRHGPTSGPGGERLPPSFWWSLGLAASASLVALSLGALGVARYHAGLVDGMVAAMADLPVPAGPFGSRDALVMGVLLIAWSGAVACWVRSAGKGAARASAWPAILAIGIGIATLSGAVLMGWTYGSPIVPGILGTVLGAPLLASGLALLRPVGVRPSRRT